MGASFRLIQPSHQWYKDATATQCANNRNHVRYKYVNVLIYNDTAETRKHLEKTATQNVHMQKQNITSTRNDFN